ncbi:hypothetical protein [Streptomyces sp. NPDC001222]|uniref:hypothetical protein n=1 Tax=Streptomyces sp. NPDC001222 TaxID=3364548 RepID=UPI0036A6EDA2
MTGQLQVPRPRLLAELDRLMASGAVVEAGPNASCGRRRSPVVDLNPDLRLAAIDLDARSVGVEVTDGRQRALASRRPRARPARGTP